MCKQNWCCYQILPLLFHFNIRGMLNQALKTNVPQGVSIRGQIASNVNITVCEIAGPPTPAMFSGTNIHQLSWGGFLVLLQRLAWNAPSGLPSTSQQLLQPTVHSSSVITMAVERRGPSHKSLNFSCFLIHILFHLRTCNKIYREEANVYTRNLSWPKPQHKLTLWTSVEVRE